MNVYVSTSALPVRLLRWALRIVSPTLGRPLTLRESLARRFVFDGAQAHRDLVAHMNRAGRR